MPFMQLRAIIQANDTAATPPTPPNTDNAEHAAPPPLRHRRRRTRPTATDNRHTDKHTASNTDTGNNDTATPQPGVLSDDPNATGTPR
eukprot:2251195-Rhodomonas_salina.1